MRPTIRLWGRIATIGALSLSAAAFAAAARADDRTLFIESAVEHADDTATLPLYRGATLDGRDVWYVVLDTSDGKTAARLKVNVSNKLANARGSRAAVSATYRDGVLVFPGTVNFAGARSVTPGPTGFPPADFRAGPRAEADYSPLVQLPDGTILNAPHVANATGRHPKVAAIDEAAGKVRLVQTRGFAGGKAVKYISTDASVELAAALENATLAPRLGEAPGLGNDGTDSSRAALGAFVNGQTGPANPNRQGLNSAILDGLDPLNVLSWTPNQGRYSPLWDVHPAAWTAGFVGTARNVRQTDWGKIRNLVAEGAITGPDGSRFGAGAIVVNCPIVSSD
jgi:hypothetical protein